MQKTEFEIYDAPVNAIAWFGTQILATAADRTVMIWDTSTQKQIFIDPDHQAPLSCLAFSNSGLLAAASGSVITVRSAEAWEEIICKEHTSSDVRTLDFCCYHERKKCSRPLLVYGTVDGSVAVVDIKNRKTVVKTVHEKRVNSVRWIGFPHTKIVSVSDGKIVELNWKSDLELRENSTRKTVSNRKVLTLLDVPYQPGCGRGGTPEPPIFKDDQKLGNITKHRRMDALTIGSTAVTTANHKIEYSGGGGGAVGELATFEVSQRIQALSWVGSYPVNFATADNDGEIVLWSIKLRHRSDFANALFGWLTPINVSVGIEFFCVIKAHGDGVTALAAPPISSAAPSWLASGSSNGTVKFWDVASIPALRSRNELWYFSGCIGIADFIGIQMPTVKLAPSEKIWRGTLSGVAARRKR